MGSNIEKLQESLMIIRQGMDLMIEAAPPLLQQQAKAEVTMTSLETFMGETERRLKALEEREKERVAQLAALEISLRKALISLFPRVESILNELERKNPKDEQSGSKKVLKDKSPLASTSKEVPQAPSNSSEEAIKKKQDEKEMCKTCAPSPSLSSPSTSSIAPGDRAVFLGRNLISAANSRDLFRIRRLISSGANVNIKSLSSGKSALSIAALNGHLECLQELVNAGADKFAIDMQGCNALHLAASRGKDVVLQYLLTKGFAIDDKSDDGETALTLAAKNGHENCVLILLEHFAEIDPKDCENRTPLHHAVISNSVECATVLVEWGADLYCRDNDGKSSMFYALQSQNSAMRDAILSITDSDNE